MYTGVAQRVLPRFREFCYCCCSPLLPQISQSILETWDALFWRPLFCLRRCQGGKHVVFVISSSQTCFCYIAFVIGNEHIYIYENFLKELKLKVKFHRDDIFYHTISCIFSFFYSILGFRKILNNSPYSKAIPLYSKYS